MVYKANDGRYDEMIYRRCGNSGLMLPLISLGIWQNFGGQMPFENSREMFRQAFDLGITHFDAANNYGPPPGSAEEVFGRILATDFKPYRDELIISTKAGFPMWPGPYGNWGSKKYLVASLDQSLKRMGLEYVDIFYHHRPDPKTPLEETMDALDHVVRQGKALYVGVSNYSADDTAAAAKILKRKGTPFVIHQPSYSMLNRGVEEGILKTCDKEGIGVIAFMPLQQGLLTSKYLKGVPEDSRAARPSGSLKKEHVNEEVVVRMNKLNDLAKERGQSLAQMALAWVLRRPEVASALIGASRASQVVENVGVIKNLDFTVEELKKIDEIINS